MGEKMESSNWRGGGGDDVWYRRGAYLFLLFLCKVESGEKACVWSVI